QPSQALDRVDHENDSAIATEPNDSGQVDPVTARKLYPAYGDYAGAAVREAQQFGGVYSAVALWRHSKHNASLRLQPHPGIHVGRKFDITSDHVIARIPINAVGDCRDRRRGIAHKGDFMRASTDEPGGISPDPPCRVLPVLVIDRAVLSQVVYHAGHRPAH